MTLNLIIRGNIGAGKTTVGEMVAQRLGCPFVPEPVKAWQESGMLKMMYDGDATAFQTYALATRMAARASVLHEKRPDVVVLDRWYDDDRLFAEINLSPSRFRAYCIYWDWVNLMHPTGPAFVVHLTTPPAICLKRIRKRGRPEEKDITEEYLERLVVRDDCDMVLTNINLGETVDNICSSFTEWCYRQKNLL